MGLLPSGKTLSWEDTKKNADLVRKVGIQQLIAHYHRLKDRTNDQLKFGDEIEYTIIRLDHENKVARLALVGPETLDKIHDEEKKISPEFIQTAWMPEYAAYMIEATPGKERPYGWCVMNYNIVEANMNTRRMQLLKALDGTDCIPLCITGFPRLGCPGFTYPSHKPTPADGISNSLFFPDEAIWSTSGRPRYKTLTRNIRERRGENQAINVPIFKDKNTPDPFVDQLPTSDDVRLNNTLIDHVCLDCVGFGLGMCCLQVTFQAVNIDEARYLYDQLAVICPIMLAISAATPAYRGYLCDIDCRWDIIAGSLDDRTREERGQEPLKNNKFVIPKSRYDTISCFIHPKSDAFNDKPFPYDEEIRETLLSQGFDDQLARHFAYLFIRDPISLFEEKLQQDPNTEMDHFENIQSTNWLTMRFKPPPVGSPIGWRVEFRPLDLQLTDFENAAFVVFVIILTRTILSFGLDFRIPISKLDENMKRAVKRDAVKKEMFHFRKSIIPDDDDDETDRAAFIPQVYGEMSIDTIMNGKGGFPGLIPLMRMYVNRLEVDVDTRCTIQQYLKLIQKRASGELLTTATWIRNFIMRHPDYKQDSVVTERITYDLLVACNRISRGETCAELTGTLKSCTTRELGSFPTMQPMKRVSEAEDTSSAKYSRQD